MENIFENSDFVLMLNQAAGDRAILAKQLNISPQQMKYVTHTEAGEGLMLKTVEQMSKISGIGENKLRELMDSGELEYIQNGNRRLIADAAIWDWYHRAKTTAKPPARQGG